LNDDHSKFKSYSLDPLPDCQLKKRGVSEIYRHKPREKDINDDYEEKNGSKTKIATTKALMMDCNGDFNASQGQRSDHIPLLVSTNQKRQWHSMEMVRAADTNAIGGCEDYIDDRNSKKSLGRKYLKSWLAGFGFFSSSNGLKGSSTGSAARNGSGILIQSQSQQQPTVTTMTKTDKETSIV
jgi:hypothetical protein